MCSTHGGNESAGAIAEADLTGLLDITERALRRVAQLPLTSAISDVQLTQTVQRLQAVVRIAEAGKYAVVAEIDQRHAARGQSAAATEDLLTRTLQLTAGEAKNQKELAAGLALVPDTAKALANGRVGVSQAAVTVKKAVEVADREDAAELLATIDKTASTAGQTLNRTRLAREIDTAVAKTGADVLAARERAAFQRRKVEWDVREGMTILRAELPPAGGAIVKAALDALSRPSEGDTRKYPQRQADALVALAEQALKDPDGLRELGGVAAQVRGARRLGGWSRRCRPPARQGTRPRLRLGHPDSPAGGNRRTAASHPPRTQAPTGGASARRARDAGAGRGRWRRGVRTRHRRRPGRATTRHARQGQRARRPVPARATCTATRHVHHIHHMGWQVWKEHGRYKAGPPPAEPPVPPEPPAPPEPLHLDNFIETEPKAFAHSG